MNFIWQLLYKAKKKQIPVDSITFVPGKEYSPYLETSLPCMNDFVTEAGQVVEVNPYYRYLEIFSHFLESKMNLSEQQVNFMFDYFIHMFYELELKTEVTDEEIMEQFVNTDILAECFGKEIKETYQMLLTGEKQIVCKNLLQVYRFGMHITTYHRLMGELFPGSAVYENKLEGYRLIVCLKADKNTYNLKKADFIHRMFLPMEYTLDIFWNKHIGILEEEETMHLDKLVLY